MLLARLLPYTWMDTSPSLTRMPWLPLVWRCNPETGVLYNSLLCDIFSTPCAYLQSNVRISPNSLLSYSASTGHSTDFQNSVLQNVESNFYAVLLHHIFQKSHIRKDYLHILTSSCYRQKRATQQTNPNSSLGISSPPIISDNRG